MTVPVTAPTAQNMFISELIFYAINMHKANAGNNTKDTILGFYNDDEIISAKRSLWLESGMHLNTRFCIRKSTESRPAEDVNVTDILEAIKFLDSTNKLPIATAVDMSRIPRRIPKQNDIISALKRIDNLETIKDQHTDNMVTLK